VKLPAEKIKERLINANKIIVDKESEEIDDYILRHHLKMNTSGTGLRYLIYEEGNGPGAKSNQQVSVSYSLYLLDGTLYDSSEKGKPVKFVIGRAEVPRGLEEGVSLLKVGGKAKLIVPSHLGYGIIGDEDKISGMTTLIYDVELLDVKDIK
jgi:FKBP-type peptidyl-prolyl cis-trans isomerase